MYLVIYVPSAFRQCLVGLLDSLHLLVRSVVDVATLLRKLLQVVLGLSLLAHQGPNPHRGVGYLHCLLWSRCSVGNLEQVTGCFQAVHIEVGGRHF